MAATIKPKVFVGSSSEAKDKGIPQAFCNALRDTASMVSWWDSPEFCAGFGTLEGLIDAVDVYDFGVFIFSPDDKTVSRGVREASTRDNVLFEYGLFLGRLGRERTFAFVEEAKEESSQVRVPTDLLGIQIPRFTNSDQHHLIASVGTATNTIRESIKKQGRRKGRIKLVSGWNYDRDTKTFSMTLSAVKLTEYRNKLSGKSLLLVATKLDENINLEDDTRMAVGKPREVSGFLTGSPVLSVSGKKRFSNATSDDIIYGHLILIPKDLNLRGCKTVHEITERGGDILESKGKRVGRKR